ncbi:MAG: ABC transporter permease [Thermoplasmata archaeon]
MGLLKNTTDLVQYLSSKNVILKYALKRVALVPIVILAVITINFLLIHLAPGGPFQILLSDPSFSPQEVLILERQYGLDKPLYMQYLIYIYNVIQGNFGISYFYSIPVITVILYYLPNTLVLAGLSLLFSSIFGILLGIIAAMNYTKSKKKVLDKSLNILSMVFYTTPSFWQGIMLILIFAVYLKLLPSTGTYVSVSGFSIIDYLSHLILPVISLSLLLVPPIYFFTRANLIDINRMDFIKAVRSKGIRERIIFVRHELRNALLPVITLIGLHGTILFGGATIIEIVFSWPGIGLLTYNAILNKDYPVLLGTLFFYALLVSLLNLIVDLIYLKVDPRIVLR